MGEGISAGYEAFRMSEMSASGIGGKICAFRAFAFSEEVVASPEGVTRLGIDGGGGGGWLLVYAHFASGHRPFLPLAVERGCAALGGTKAAGKHDGV
jgi:hypothetical protein